MESINFEDLDLSLEESRDMIEFLAKKEMLVIISA